MVRMLDRDAGVSVAPAESSSAKLLDATRGGVTRFAAFIDEDARLRGVLAGFVVNQGIPKGYSHSGMLTIYSRIEQLSLSPGQRSRASTALNDLHSAYGDALKLGKTEGLPIGEINEKFTGAICEAVAYHLLDKSGRRDIIRDARYSIPGRQYWTNVDFHWDRADRSWCEMYECKTSPQTLLRNWQLCDSREREWAKDKLFMMLNVASVLEKAGWSILVSCFTLKRKSVCPDITAFRDPPEKLAFFFLDDWNSFPPPMPS